AVSSLEDRGLVEVREDGKRLQVWLVHPLHGEVVRAGMPMLRGRMIRKTLADATDATGSQRREDVLRLATLRLESGAAGHAQVLLAAARQARAAEDYPAASRLARAALDAGGGAEAGYVLGDTLSEQGFREEAESVLAAATEAAGNDGDLTLITVSRSDNLFWHLGREDDALAIVRASEAKVADRVCREQLVAQRASFDLILGRPLVALEAVEPNLTASEGRALVESCIVAAPAYIYTGRPDTGGAVADRGFAVHAALDDDLMAAHPGVHIISKAISLSLAGRLHEAGNVARAGYEAAIGARRPARHAWFAMILAGVTLQQGRLATAARYSREGAALFRELRHQGERWCLGGVALALGQMGRGDEAVEALAALDATPGRWLFTEPDVQRGRAWALLAAGHLPEAREALVAAADMAASTGQTTLEVIALHDLARVAATREIAQRLAIVAAGVEGPIAPVMAAHAAAIVDGDAMALQEAAAVFADLGAPLLAAEAASEAATAWRRNGDPRRAEACAATAQEYAADCEGASTPALVAGEAPVPLTTREREVATLAAAGHTSKAIADRLYLSVRTVDNHLQRAYTKLGVRSRDELGAALRPGSE
ncbi:MAG TPA: helix-turn-helix transcriptional regulator, partial [Acidimicrobiales bacterium]